jgi:hypothetical protein
VPPDNPATGEPERRDPDPREPAWQTHAGGMPQVSPPAAGR